MAHRCVDHSRVVALIRKKFSIDYHITHVARILHALDWSPQKPERRALERNEAAIQKWKNTDWARVKKTPHGWAPTWFSAINGKTSVMWS